ASSKPAPLVAQRHARSRSARGRRAGARRVQQRARETGDAPQMNSAARAPRPDDAVAPQAHDELPLATPPVELHEGDVVGRFRIGAVMGVGGHGVVYAASLVELGYPVALKVMDRYAGRDPRRRARFRREALIGARP